MRWRSGRVIVPEPSPFLLVKNLDKKDLSWFGTDRYLGIKKSGIIERFFLKSSDFYLIGHVIFPCENTGGHGLILFRDYKASITFKLLVDCSDESVQLLSIC